MFYYLLPKTDWWYFSIKGFIFFITLFPRIKIIKISVFLHPFSYSIKNIMFLSFIKINELWGLTSGSQWASIYLTFWLLLALCIETTRIVTCKNKWVLLALLFFFRQLLVKFLFLPLPILILSAVHLSLSLASKL